MKSINNGTLKPTQVDLNFIRHELREKQLMDGGMSSTEAHNATLKEQGMSAAGHDALYTKEAIIAGDAQEAAKFGIKQK